MGTRLVVFLKEFRENLRDRRAVLVALVIAPLFGPLLFGAMLQLSIDRGEREIDRDVALTVVNAEAAPQLVGFLSGRGVVIRELATDDAGARAEIASRRSRVVLRVPDDAGERLAAARPVPLQLYADSSRRDDQRYVARVRTLVAAYAQTIATQRLVLRGVDPLLLAPLTVQDVDVSTPAGRAAVVIGMLSFFLILALMTGGMYLAIDSTVGERERGTLEALLATPASRTALVHGKLLATATFMALSLVLTTASFFVVLGRVDLESLGMSANLGWPTALRVVGVTAPLIPLAAALLTIVAAFTRSAREAQAWLSVTQLVPTLPLVFAGLTNLAPTLPLMFVPSLSQHFLIQRLLRAEPLPPEAVAASAAGSLALGLVGLWLAGRLFRRERMFH